VAYLARLGSSPTPTRHGRVGVSTGPSHGTSVSIYCTRR
jgi:hypothetical protein